MKQSNRLTALPDTVYVPDFITHEEEQFILKEIARLPSTRWTILSRRRLLSLPGVLTGKTGDTLIEAPLPTFLTKSVFEKFAELGIFTDSPHGQANHCLVNEYEPSQGIFPHEDGPAYYPVTATISLSSYTVLDIYKKTADGEKEFDATWRILQEPRSLLVTAGDMYKNTLHGIAEVEEDRDLTAESITNWNMLGDAKLFESGSAIRQTRISLTYRDVLKVAKVGGALKFMNKR